MKSLTVSLIVLANCMALSQPIPEWTSPQGRDSVSIGWTDVSNPPPGIRFFQMDRTSIRIMSGPYSTTPTTTIAVTPNEADFRGRQPYFAGYVDISGDGVSDIVLFRRYGSSNPYRDGFRWVNPITGADIILFDAPDYSCTLSTIADLDGDGVVEFAVRREPFPPANNSSYEILVFQTAGHSTSTDIAPLPPTLEWTSPPGRDSVAMGWLELHPSQGDYRFYMLERMSIRIMSGPYSTSPSVTIPFTASETNSGQPYPYFFTYADMSGDGARDIITYRSYGPSYPYRYGFRAVNAVTGGDIFLFDAPDSNYLPRQVADLDNDGFVELAVSRSAYPPTSNDLYEIIVFQTAGQATSAGDNAEVLLTFPEVQRNRVHRLAPAPSAQFGISHMDDTRLQRTGKSTWEDPK